MPLKGNAAYLNFFLIMDENNTLSEYNKIPLGHNRTKGAVYSKINSALHLDIRKSSHASFPELNNTVQS